MGLDKYYNHLLLTHTDWYQFLTESGVTDSDAIAAYNQCAASEPHTTVQLDILPFIWGRFETKVWHEFLTSLVIKKLDTKLHHDSNIITYLPSYLPSLKRCAPYIDSAMHRSGARAKCKSVLKNVVDIIEGSSPSSDEGHLISLALPELRTPTEIVDSLVATTEWSEITALPIVSLARIFDAVEEDSRFTEGSPNDLRLCGVLAGWRCEGAVYDYYVPAHRNADMATADIRKIELVLTLAESNRYWRALVFNFFSSNNYDHWTNPCLEMLNNYSRQVDNGLGGCNTLHTLRVMEAVSNGSSFAPSWVGNFLKSKDKYGLSESSQVWAMFVPEWATNGPTWDALGLTHEEKVQACLSLVSVPGVTKGTELPENLSLC